MVMIVWNNVEEVMGDVRDDVLAGLKELTSADEIGFHSLPHFSGLVNPTFDASPGGSSIAIVAWRYVGTHEADFAGVAPTGREITVDGITIVDGRGDEVLMSRHVDWISVMGQLGLSATGRPVVRSNKGDSP